ncbi:MAG: S8 family serine peptidase [Pseudomonadota bacterium]
MSILSLDPALAELLSEGDQNESISLVGRIVNEQHLPTDARVITRFGNIATFRVPRGAVQSLYASNACDALEAARPIQQPVFTPPAPRSTSMRRASVGALPEEANTRLGDRVRPKDVSLNGEGVVIGVLDWSLDIAHPAFRHPDGRTRVRALWDQGGQTPSGHDNRWGYGRIYMADEINDALFSGRDPYAELDYTPADGDRAGDGSHGTHVCSIAAGSRNSVNGGGVAPDADIVFINLAHTPRVLGPENLGSSTSLLEALDFLFDAAGDAPCVANLSVGAHSGNHKGRSLVELGMDQALWLKPGRAIINSAGNYREKRSHAKGRVGHGESMSLPFFLPAHDTNDSELEIFYALADRFRIEVTGPDGASIEVPVGDDSAILYEGSKVGHAYHRPDLFNEDNHFDLFLYRNAPAGNWSISITAEQVEDGRYDAWIERDPSKPPYFLGDQVERSGTLGTLANGAFTITCGAFDAHVESRPLGSFSSAGPTRGGRLKPEVVAPGVKVLAARSTPRDSQPDERYVRKSGTSMAAPHVAGTVALMFEAAREPMEITDTRALLFSSLTTPPGCNRAPCDREDIHRSGYGFLDCGEAVQKTIAWQQVSDAQTFGGNQMNKENLGSTVYEQQNAPTQATHTEHPAENIADVAERSAVPHAGVDPIHCDCHPAIAESTATSSLLGDPAHAADTEPVEWSDERSGQDPAAVREQLIFQAMQGMLGRGPATMLSVARSLMSGEDTPDTDIESDADSPLPSPLVLTRKVPGSPEPYVGIVLPSGHDESTSNPLELPCEQRGTGEYVEVLEWQPHAEAPQLAVRRLADRYGRMDRGQSVHALDDSLIDRLINALPETDDESMYEEANPCCP